jgi:hypothetical protein
VAVVAWLVGFHALLLGRRLSDLSLLDPAVGLRWLAGGLLVAVLYLLQRTGVRLADPRRAAVIALLVLLVHLQLPAAPLAGTPGHGLGWQLLAVLPAVLAAAIGALVVLLAGRSAGPRRAEVRPWRRERDACLPDRLLPAFPLLSRPPPHPPAR